MSNTFNELGLMTGRYSFLLVKPKYFSRITSSPKITPRATQNHVNAIVESTPGMPPMLMPSKPVKKLVGRNMVATKVKR